MQGIFAPATLRRLSRTVGAIIAGVFVATSASAQTSAPAQAPQPAPAANTRTFDLDGGIMLFYVKPDKTADFEAAMAKLKEVLQKSEKPERKQQATTWKLFKAAEPAGTNLVYMFVIQPPLKGADYMVGNLLFEGMKYEDAKPIYDKFADSLANLSFLNLSIVQDFGKTP